MDLFFDIIADLVLKLLGKVTKDNKNARTQTVVDILVASVFLLAVDGYAIWNAVSYYRQGKVLVAAIFASVMVISLLLIGFVVFRRIMRKRKDRQEP